MKKIKSPRNKTIDLSSKEIKDYSSRLISLSNKCKLKEILNKTLNQDIFEVISFLPNNFVDLLIIDPPYNLSKRFNSFLFKAKSISDYSAWINSFIVNLKKILKPTASIYFCGDWFTSISIPMVLEKYFTIRNRITWEREKGRGAKSNWKAGSEDIWFCTVSNEYTFNSDAVKLNRKVIAPYRDENGDPKDWNKQKNGDYRLTGSSNLWNEISVPFWSMSENTEHPTQKPEKLVAKLILASSNEGDIVFDPFLGSGTTSVTAKKLKRNFIGVEIDKYYACIAEKRLELAGINNSIQGYDFGVFWERNTIPIQTKTD